MSTRTTESAIALRLVGAMETAAPDDKGALRSVECVEVVTSGVGEGSVECVEVVMSGVGEGSVECVEVVTSGVGEGSVECVEEVISGVGEGSVECVEEVISGVGEGSSKPNKLFLEATTCMSGYTERKQHYNTAAL